jgi:hypothetical protein
MTNRSRPAQPVQVAAFLWVRDLLARFDRVMRKTVQGLFFGLYERLVPGEQVELRLVSLQRFLTPEEVIDQMKPSPLRDITDEPLPDITPGSWPVRERLAPAWMHPIFRELANG